MKKIFLFSLLLLNINAFAQDFDNLMTKRYFSCEDVTTNCVSLFIEYYSENKLDTASNLLIYWQKKCGMNEAIQRAKILLSLKGNNYNDSILDYKTFDYIYNQYNVNNRYNNQFYYRYNRGFNILFYDFDDFLRNEFDKLKLFFNEKQVEYFLCEAFGTNSENALLLLQNNNYNSIIDKKYNDAIEENLKLPEMNMALIAGIWVPFGKLNTLGLHPSLGGQLGWKKGKMNYDITLMVRFMAAQNRYLAYRKETGEFESTYHFLGFYFGFDVGRDIFVRKKHELQVVGGIALDGFDVLNEDKQLGYKGASVSSFNVNAGLAYRYYVKKNLYLGLKAKYNVVDYTLSRRVLDLRGHAVTVDFTVGFLMNYAKYDNLRRLGYKFRE